MKNHLNYKGYIGSVDYSDSDKCLFGKVIGVSDLINYEAESVTELKINFEDAIDDYLELCKKIGKEPNKNFKGVFNVRTSPNTHKSLVYLASRKKMNLNELVDRALNYTLENEGVVLDSHEKTSMQAS